ncbi:hypothetical protein Rwratislav_40605 [Rhodococcus wratislaviensis IFP 2016]|nr:hypothetical protein Rwratislav_40605 [Rhodococcus wratislaviensis IFP 2016]CAG7634522.1 hypothetical protein E143388_07613 [Rhodococcus opacus]
MVGFFAAAWFGWAMAVPTPGVLTALLNIGAVAGLIVVVLGIGVAVHSPAESSAMTDRAVRRRYVTVVVVEVLVLVAGAVVLALAGLTEWTPVWVCAVVGVHFVPLASIFGESSLTVLGVLLGAVATGGLVLGLSTNAAPSTVVGTGAGLCLLAFAVIAVAGKRFARR